MPHELRRVIVTGATRGIGRGVTRYLVRHGGLLAVCARDRSALYALKEEMSALPGQVHAQVCDVENPVALRTFIVDAARKMGGLDALINNACYIPRPVAMEDYDDAVFDHALKSGVGSVYTAMRAAFPFLVERGGAIVNFTSIGGLRGARGQVGYGAAKTALIGLTRVAAAEWGRFNINVNCVAPMAMSDAWSTYLSTLPADADPFLAVGVHRNAMGRVGDPERDVAPVVAFLCSEEARYVTGAIIPVDGGLLDLE